MVIYLGRRLPDASCGLPERNSETGYLFAPIRPCSKWGLPCRARRRVARWALTPPFHPCPQREKSRPLAVCSLWHFPSGRPAWGLPSILPCGARTFLIPKGTRPPSPLVTFLFLGRIGTVFCCNALICQSVSFSILLSAHVSDLKAIKRSTLHPSSLIKRQKSPTFDFVRPIHLANHEFAVGKYCHPVGFELCGYFKALDQRAILCDIVGRTADILRYCQMLWMGVERILDDYAAILRSPSTNFTPSMTRGMSL